MSDDPQEKNEKPQTNDSMSGDTTKTEDILSSATDGATEVTFSIIFDNDNAASSAGTGTTDSADAGSTEDDSTEDAEEVDDEDADTAVTNAAVRDDDAASDVNTTGNEDDADAADEDEDTDDTVSTPADALSIEKGISATVRSTGQEDDILLRSYPTFSLTDVTVVKKSDSRRILDDVTMSFYAGNLYGVGVDPDYAEQHSTFIQVITGLRRPTSGTVMMRSANLAELDTSEVRGHRLGIVTQKYRVREGLNAVDNITYAMDASNRNFLKPKKTIAKELLKHVGFPGDDTKDDDGPNSPWRVRAGALPPVQQLRVAIARAISCEAEVLILDEPVVGLDDDESESIMSTLQSLAHDKDPRCVIVVSSDERILDAGDERVDLI